LNPRNTATTRPAVPASSPSVKRMPRYAATNALYGKAPLGPFFVFANFAFSPIYFVALEKNAVLAVIAVLLASARRVG